jgi:hypothetical protein
MERKTIGTKVKRAVAFCFKPIFRITVVTSEEQIFLNHAHKFLDHECIKPEFRKTIIKKDGK